MDLVLVYTASGVYLSRRTMASEGEHQARWADFQTSLGPWDAAAVIDFLDAEYPDLVPRAAEQVHALLATAALEHRLCFRD